MTAYNHPPMPPGGGATGNKASLRFFLPLSEESAPSISTRGQALPALIQSRSSTNLSDIRQSSPYRRKGSRTGLSKMVSDDETDLELGKTRSLDRYSGMGSYSALNLNEAVPAPPTNFPLARGIPWGVMSGDYYGSDERRSSILLLPQMRSQRLIGNSNPRYKWEQYYKTPEELKKMKKPLRAYYERNNYLIQQYMYIDRLLDSSLPHNLIEEYNQPAQQPDIPETISEEPSSEGEISPSTLKSPDILQSPAMNGMSKDPVKVKRTPKDIYMLPEPTENTPLVSRDGVDDDDNEPIAVPQYVPEEEADSGARIVTVAIYINLVANICLLILKIIVTVLTSSLSVLASLVDAALDFLSTIIVWVTTTLINRSSSDRENYPVGRQRLEPLGVLVFSVIMVTSFFQVGLQCISRLSGPDHSIVQLTPSAIAIMSTTVVVKFLCWLWCRLIRNSSVQALAQDAMTDVVFNIFSIIFPLVGFYAKIWYLDPLGGLLLSIYVIMAWSRTTKEHILNLTGRAASKDERNILLYLTMRFAHTIRFIQALQAYHAGDKLNVEVDIVLDESMSLKDSHDLGESLQYVLESVPGVERAFVHSDYRSENLPSHMRQN